MLSQNAENTVDRFHYQHDSTHMDGRRKRSTGRQYQKMENEIYGAQNNRKWSIHASGTGQNISETNKKKKESRNLDDEYTMETMGNDYKNRRQKSVACNLLTQETLPGRR